MPIIKSSTELRNNYNEISNICHSFREPIFITKNGNGDLAVMSMETYEEIIGRFEIYGLLKEGTDAADAGKAAPAAETVAGIRENLK